MQEPKKNLVCSSIILLFGLSTQNVFSGTMGPVVPDWGYVGTLSLGSVWANNQSAQTFYLAPEIEKTYTTADSGNAVFDGEVFLGMQHHFQNPLWLQLGLAVAATSNANFSGSIWDDANPEFNNFDYEYSIQHTHLAAKAKLLYDTGFIVMPWVSGSVGVAWNQANKFTIASTISEAIDTPYYPSNTQTAFTYNIGAGVQYALTQNFQLGIGYEFADWGKTLFGQANGQTLTNGFGINHVYTNGFLVNLTYSSPTLS